MDRSVLQDIIKEIRVRYKYKNIKELGNDIGVSENRLYSFINDRIKKYDDIESAIKIKFPNDLKTPSTFKTKNNEFLEIGNHKAIKVYKVSMKAHAQYVDEFYNEANDITFEYEYFQVDHYGRGQYMAFEIEGDSMDTDHLILNGCTVLAREIGQHLWRSGLYQSKWGHIVITNKNILYKDIINQEGNIITLHSRNDSPEFSDFKLPLGYCDEPTYINQIYRVISLHNVK